MSDYECPETESHGERMSQETGWRKTWYDIAEEVRGR